MKNKLLLVILLIILLAGSGLFIYLITRGTIKPAAQSAQPTIYINPASASENLGSTFTVDIMANSAGSTIMGIDVFYLHYDNQKLSAQAVTNGTIFPNYQSRNNIPIDVAAGTINLSGYFNPGPSNQQAVSGIFAKVTFKALLEGQATLSFDFSPGATTDTNMSSDTGGGNIVDILQAASGATLTIKKIDNPPGNQNGTTPTSNGTGQTSPSTPNKSSTGTTSTPQQATKLPANIQTQPTPIQTTITLTKNEVMKPWVLWFLYAIIPAFLAGGTIYFYLRRKKANRNDEMI
jgi:hypothetical protein